MTAGAVLETARKAGASIVMDGPRPRLVNVPQNLVPLIIEHKPALMEWLKRGDTVQKIRVPWTAEHLWIVPRAEPGGISQHDTVEELAASGIPRGAIWTETDLETLLSAGVRGEALKAVALARLTFDADLVGVHASATDRAPSGTGRLHSAPQTPPSAGTGPAVTATVTEPQR